MVVRKQKKSRKLRGSRTMGWGIKGQHRDRGSQSGRQVGMHKHKWSWTVKYGKSWYGKHGFINPTSKKVSAISLRVLNELLLAGKLSVEEKDGKKIVDLTKYGYQKLLGSGTLSFPISVVVNKCTEKAKEKVSKIGGEVILTSND